MGTALRGPWGNGCNTGTAGSSVHRNAVVWVIPWEFAIEADFRLFPCVLAVDKALLKVLQVDSPPAPQLLYTESKPCSLVFSPILEVQPRAPPRLDPGTSWEYSTVL